MLSANLESDEVWNAFFTLKMNGNRPNRTIRQNLNNLIISCQTRNTMTVFNIKEYANLICTTGCAALLTQPQPVRTSVRV